MNMESGSQIANPTIVTAISAFEEPPRVANHAVPLLLRHADDEDTFNEAAHVVNRGGIVRYFAIVLVEKRRHQLHFERVRPIPLLQHREHAVRPHRRRQHCAVALERHAARIDADEVRETAKLHWEGLDARLADVEHFQLSAELHRRRD